MQALTRDQAILLCETHGIRQILNDSRPSGRLDQTNIALFQAYYALFHIACTTQYPEIEADKHEDD